VIDDWGALEYLRPVEATVYERLKLILERCVAHSTHPPERATAQAAFWAALNSPTPSLSASNGPLEKS